MSDDQDRDAIRGDLMDWRDFHKTPRKIIARRLLNRRFLPQEAMAMRAAHEMLMDGDISILTRIEPAAKGPGPIVTYIAERVK